VSAAATVDERFQRFYEQVPSLALIGDTPLLPLNLFDDEFPDFRVLAKQEWRNPGGSLKDRPVARMLCEAILDGSLTREKTILDSSSGNAGIAYAMIGAALGYRVRLYVPANASQERKDRLAAHGADVVYTDAVEGYDHALRTCHAEAHAHPERYFFCNQYANDHNWQSHFHGTAGEILAQTGGELTHFVGGVGTDGHGGLADGCRRLLGKRAVDVHDGDARALGGQLPRGRSADAAGAAGDDGDAVFETHHSLLPSAPHPTPAERRWHGAITAIRPAGMAPERGGTSGKTLVRWANFTHLPMAGTGVIGLINTIE